MSTRRRRRALPRAGMLLLHAVVAAAPAQRLRLAPARLSLPCRLVFLLYEQPTQHIRPSLLLKHLTALALPHGSSTAGPVTGGLPAARALFDPANGLSGTDCSPWRSRGCMSGAKLRGAACARAAMALAHYLCRSRHARMQARGPTDQVTKHFVQWRAARGWGRLARCCCPNGGSTGPDGRRSRLKSRLEQARSSSSLLAPLGSAATAPCCLLSTCI